MIWRDVRQHLGFVGVLLACAGVGALGALIDPGGWGVVIIATVFGVMIARVWCINSEGHGQ